MARTYRNGPEEKKVVDTLRLSDAEWYECVSEMDRESARNCQDHTRRARERLPYRNLHHVLITVRNYCGRLQYFQSRPYDLSESGIGFLHGAYMHVGTSIELQLMHRVTGMTKVRATVRGCSHIKNKIHCVGAQFDELIELDDYLLAQAG
ncbi:MAG: PilZ domain-containing protein [Planctomycetota bacterium]